MPWLAIEEDGVWAIPRLKLPEYAIIVESIATALAQADLASIG